VTEIGTPSFRDDIGTDYTGRYKSNYHTITDYYHCCGTVHVSLNYLFFFTVVYAVLEMTF